LTKKSVFSASCLGLYLGALFIFVSVDLVESANSGAAYKYADWLINYSAGFVRRGLSGEIILLLSEALELPPSQIYLAILLILYAATIFLMFRKYRNLFFSTAVLFLLFPTSIFFWILDSGTIGRKEILLYLFALVLYESVKDKIPLSRFQWMVFGGFAGLIVMMHEGMFFFLPIVFLFVHLFSPFPSRGKFLLNAAIFFGPAFCALIFSVHSSSVETIGPILDALPDHGTHLASLCRDHMTGAICWLQMGPERAGEAFWRPGAFGLVRMASMIFIYLFLLLFVLFHTTSDALRARAFFFLILGFLFSAPLFFVAVDWGRWISIVTILTAIFAPVDKVRPLAPHVVLLIAVMSSVYSIKYTRSERFELYGVEAVVHFLKG